MSVVTTYAIFCDRCGNWIGDVVSLKDSRQQAKVAGWKRVRQEGKLSDVCPDCFKKEKDHTNG